MPSVSTLLTRSVTASKPSANVLLSDKVACALIMRSRAAVEGNVNART